LKAIYETGLACARLNEEFAEEDIENLIREVQPALDVAPIAMAENDLNGVAEGRLGKRLSLSLAFFNQ
jgi:hypothetical protein